MEISDVETITFSYESRTTLDAYGHTHPSDPNEATKTITRVAVDGGPDGYAFGGSDRGIAYAASILRGCDPLERQVLWRRLHRAQRLGKETLSALDLAAVDCALWDVAGRHADQPVYELLGGSGGEVEACAFTMNGDDDPAGLGTPEAIADFATDLVDRGYWAINLHGWMPPFEVSTDRDLEACAAVREAVGPDVTLTFTPYHHYDRLEARELCRGLADLGFAYVEEPMDDDSASSYAWLADQTALPVMGAKSLPAGARPRAEWIRRDASDLVRIHVGKVGGLTPAVQTVALCDAFGVPCGVSGATAPVLQLLALPQVGDYYQLGTLHPNHDYIDHPPWLDAPLDPLTPDGTVQIPARPGLGLEIDWAYVDQNRVAGDPSG